MLSGKITSLILPHSLQNLNDCLGFTIAILLSPSLADPCDLGLFYWAVLLWSFLPVLSSADPPSASWGHTEQNRIPTRGSLSHLWKMPLCMYHLYMTWCSYMAFLSPALVQLSATSLLWSGLRRAPSHPGAVWQVPRSLGHHCAIQRLSESGGFLFAWLDWTEPCIPQQDSRVSAVCSTRWDVSGLWQIHSNPLGLAYHHSWVPPVWLCVCGVWMHGGQCHMGTEWQIWGCLECQCGLWKWLSLLPPTPTLFRGPLHCLSPSHRTSNPISF